MSTNRSEFGLSAARRSAARYLDQSARTSSEIRRHLERRGASPDDIRAVIDELRSAGLIDDEAFAHAWAESRTRARGLGRLRVEHELRLKGFSSEAAQAAIERSADGTEAERATAAARRWLGGAAIDGPDVRRRLTGHLARKGFDWETIEQVISHPLSNDQ